MDKIFEGSFIKDVHFKNRIFRSATYEKMATDDGHFTDELFELYEGLAKGGVGCIIGSYAYVLKEEQPASNMLGIYDDSFIDEYKKIADIVHQCDAKYIQQIVYGGSQTTFNIGKRKILGPSSVEHRLSKVTPKEMSYDDIQMLKEAFVNAAIRCKKAGLDGVQIHCAHGYLLSQFLSPYYNRRQDEYGGSIENRARIILEIYEQIRIAVGFESDFLVGIKINCSDFDKEGATYKECEYVSIELDKRGIDFIEISGSSEYSKDEIKYDSSVFRDYGKDISKKVKARIILVCKNKSIVTMEKIMNESKIKYFSICRPLICQPNLPDLWSENINYKVKCIYCGNCLKNDSLECILK